MITYDKPTDLDGKSSVNVTFQNEQGEIYIKEINIPKNENGSVDQEYFQNVLEGQLMGIAHKFKMGLIKFNPPSELTKSSEEVTPKSIS